MCSHRTLHIITMIMRRMSLRRRYFNLFLASFVNFLVVAVECRAERLLARFDAHHSSHEALAVAEGIVGPLTSLYARGGRIS
jgi:hypothetical protein